MTTEKKKIVLLGVFFAFLVAAMVIIFAVVKPGASNSGKAKINFTVVFEDETSKEYKIKTDQQYLYGALNDEGLIGGSDGEWGFYVTTVAGVTADDSKQQWWALYVDDEMSNYGVSETPVEDGKSYKFVLTTGW